MRVRELLWFCVLVLSGATFAANEASSQCPGGYGGGPPPPPPPPPPPSLPPQTGTGGPGDVTAPSTPGPGGPGTPRPGSTPSPGPTTGGPAPAVPGPGGPFTGGPAGPSAGSPRAGAAARGPTTGARPRGLPMSFERGPTSLDLLQIRWDHPVYVPEAGVDGQTRSQSVIALPREEAFALVRGTDPRPLLVLRECILCKRDDSAMLDKRRSNERTILLSHYFHCVKLPTHVAQEKHHLRNLFDAERPAHVFVSSADGSGLIPMSGAQSQKELWNAMTQVLRRDYAGKPDKAVDGILRLLDQFDRVDAKETRLQNELDEELERSGESSSKYRRLDKQLEETRAEHEQLVEELQLLQAVELR